MSGFAIEVAHGAATHPGRRRSANEDAHLATRPLFLVADGMGGHDAGAAASAAVIDAFGRLDVERPMTVPVIRETIEVAANAVAGMGGSRAAGTTLTGVIATDVDGVGYWLVVNIGDSRTYRFADGRLEQITVDHSTVQELLDAGVVTAEEAATHRQRNEITRAIGAGSAAHPDFWLFPAEPGDRMLACSDGLTGELPDVEIARILATRADPEEAATELVHEALVRGGRDNITVVIVDAITVAGAAGDEETSPAGRNSAAPSEDADDTEDTLPRERVRA